VCLFFLCGVFKVGGLFLSFCVFLFPFYFAMGFFFFLCVGVAVAFVWCGLFGVVRLFNFLVFFFFLSFFFIFFFFFGLLRAMRAAFVGLFVLIACGGAVWHRIRHERRLWTIHDKVSCRILPSPEGLSPARPCATRRTESRPSGQHSTRSAESSRLDIVFTVQSDLPVKVDSSVKIMSMSPLGDNHLEIYPGTAQTPRAASGAALPSLKYVDFNALTAQLNDLNPQAQELLRNLNDRASGSEKTIARVNDLLGPQNAQILPQRSQCARNARRKPPSNQDHLHNVNAVSEKLQPLLEDFRKTSEQANQTLTMSMPWWARNRADVRQACCRASTHAYKHDRRHCAA